MAQVKESKLVKYGVYSHLPIFGICKKCFRIGTPLMECTFCKVKVCSIASMKRDGNPSFS